MTATSGTHRFGIASGVSALIAATIAAVAVAVAAPTVPDAVNTVDPDPGVGYFASMALDADDNPVIAYYDASADDLRLVHCTNTDCSSPQTPRAVDSGGGSDVGRYSSLALTLAGNPTVAYYDATAGDLMLLACTNSDCSGTQTPQRVDSAGDVGAFAALVLDAADRPVIAYHDGTNDDLKVIHCTNTDCSGAQTPQRPDEVGLVGRYASIALDTGGRPVVAYYDNSAGDLKVLHCTNVDCSGAQSPQRPDSDNDVGRHNSLELDNNDNPVISYYDTTNRDLKLLHCTNATCAGTQTPRTPDSGGTVGQYTSLALDDNGHPVISYWDLTLDDLKILSCINPECAGIHTPRVPDSVGAVGSHTSLALDSMGNVVVAYRDVDAGSLKLLRCRDAEACASPDEDNDGFPDGVDNCPGLRSTDQADRDGDGLGDPCDERDNRIPAVCASFSDANVVVGTAAADELIGTSGSDVIVGRGGADIISGRGGNDCLVAGRGDDVVKGGGGRDRMYGNAGRDVMSGNGGNDVIHGGKHRDTLDGGRGRDRCSSGSRSNVRCERS